MWCCVCERKMKAGETVCMRCGSDQRESVQFDCEGEYAVFLENRVAIGSVTPCRIIVTESRLVAISHYASWRQSFWFFEFVDGGRTLVKLPLINIKDFFEGVIPNYQGYVVYSLTTVNDDVHCFFRVPKWFHRKTMELLASI